MKILAFITVFILVGRGVLAQNIKFVNPKPNPGSVVKFIYDPKDGNLSRFEGLSCLVTSIFSRESYAKTKVKLTKNGLVYDGEFIAPDSVKLAVFAFEANGIRDENPNGYYTKFYQNDRNVFESSFLEGYLLSGLGNRLAKIKIDKAKGLLCYENAFEESPTLREKYFNDYLSTLNAIDVVKSKQVGFNQIKAINQQQLSEKTLLNIAQIYSIIGLKKESDSVHNLTKAKFPRGSYALSLAIRGLPAFKDAYEREERGNQLVKDFGLSNEMQLARLKFEFLGLGEAFFSIHKYDKVEHYVEKFDSKLTRAIVYNKFSSKNLKERVNLEFSAKMSKRSLDLIDSLKYEKTPANFTSQQEYFSSLDDFYEIYVGTYIRILSMLGRYSEALSVAEAAVVKYGSNIDIIEAYIDQLLKNEKREKVIEHSEKFILAGYNSEKIKSLLKEVYIGNEAFDMYYKKLEQNAKRKIEERFRKEMVDFPAPKFVLNNLKGEVVSLEKLKGKIVIIDYWATWCGPCIASFPGMQAAVDKYKNNPDVVFLFINTWEGVKNRKKYIQDWMATNKRYSFEVLLDRQKEDGSEDFEVIEKYQVSGIPTKFIIDGKGRIRFKKVGGSDNMESIVKELDIMIKMAQEN